MSERARVTITTRHERAGAIAESVSPDDTAEMETDSADGTIRTRIERDSVAGLRATADDAVVNLAVAIETVALAADPTSEQTGSTEPNDATQTDDTTQ